MTEETTTEVTAEAPVEQAPQNINISIEQICAAILSTVGSVEVQLPALLANYEGQSIAINQNDETKAVTFSIADAPVATEAPAENAQEAE